MIVKRETGKTIFICGKKADRIENKVKTTEEAVKHPLKKRRIKNV